MKKDPQDNLINVLLIASVAFSLLLLVGLLYMAEEPKPYKSNVEVISPNDPDYYFQEPKIKDPWEILDKVTK